MCIVWLCFDLHFAVDLELKTFILRDCYDSVTQLCPTMPSNGLKHSRLPSPSPSTRVCSNPCPVSQWCHPTISSCHPLLLLSICPSIMVFSNVLTFCIRWPKYWSFSLSISPSNEYSGLISFRTDQFDLLAVQWTPKSLLQHHSSKASAFFIIQLQCSAFFIVQLSHSYYWKKQTNKKPIALTTQTQ